MSEYTRNPLLSCSADYFVKVLMSNIQGVSGSALDPFSGKGGIVQALGNYPCFSPVYANETEVKYQQTFKLDLSLESGWATLSQVIGNRQFDYIISAPRKETPDDSIYLALKNAQKGVALLLDESAKIPQPFQNSVSLQQFHLNRGYSWFYWEINKNKVDK